MKVYQVQRTTAGIQTENQQFGVLRRIEMCGGTTVMFRCAQEVRTFQGHVLDFANYLILLSDTRETLTSVKKHPLYSQQVSHQR